MHSYYFDQGLDYRPADCAGRYSSCAPTGFGGPLYEDPPPLTRAQRKALRGRRSGRRRHAGLIFVVFLLLIGATAAVLLALRMEAPALALPSGYIPSGGGVTTIPLPQASDPPTTVERAPTGTGVTLDLSHETGEALTYQVLYQKCIPSIAGIRSYKTSGGASGTGVVMTQDGYVITNYHVIQGASRVEVLLHDDSVHDALLVGGDQTNDLAVLKIDCAGLTPAEFGDSDLLQVGDTALAIGNPLGEQLRGTMTDGIISAINRDVNSDGNTMTLLQTTAALNSGNSGGALLNVYGQVVGITNMKMTSYSDTIEGIGFAIPSVTAKAVVDELIERGHLAGRPTLGITGAALSEEMAAARGLVPGVYVSTVDPNSGAQKGGMFPGDVITDCNGQAVSSVEDINAIKADFKAGDTLTFRVFRGEGYLDLEITLMERYELDQ